MMTIALSSEFLRAYSEIPKGQQKKVREFIELFREKPDAKGIGYEPVRGAQGGVLLSVRIDLAYRRTVGRLPTDAERTLAIRYIGNFKPSKPTEPTAQRLEAWTRFYQTLFASLDFRYVH